MPNSIIQLLACVIFLALGLAATLVTEDELRLVHMEPSVNIFTSSMWFQEPIDRKQIIKLVFVLKHSRASIEKLENILLDISSPTSNNYGNWIQPERIRKLISPATSNITTVTDYLHSYDIPQGDIRISRFGGLVHASMPVYVANQLLHTEFALYRSLVQRSTTIVRVVRPYYLPHRIADVVALVGEVVRFPSIHNTYPKFRSSEGNKAGNKRKKSKRQRRHEPTTEAPTTFSGNGISTTSSDLPVHISSKTTTPTKQSPPAVSASTASTTIEAPGDGGGGGGGGDAEFQSCGVQCMDYVTPSVLRETYGLDTVKLAAPGNSLAVAAFQLQQHHPADVTAFSTQCSVPSIVDHLLVISSATGDDNTEDRKPLQTPPSQYEQQQQSCDTGSCVENLLAIQYMESLAYPIPLTVMYQSSFSLLDWIDEILSMENPPLVHSLSFGHDETRQISLEYQHAVNVQFMISAALGLTIVASAGDSGVVWGTSKLTSTSTSSHTQSNKVTAGSSGGGGQQKDFQFQFQPSFPATSPYVTTVGATDFQKPNRIGDETAWSCSGGGFSDHFPAPSWQTGVVQQYAKIASGANILPDRNQYQFNLTGRGFPDISVLGGDKNRYCVPLQGDASAGVVGTSAAAAVVAGMVAQLNNLRLADGKSSLGWLNPWLYSDKVRSQCFHDISDGSTNQCTGSGTGRDIAAAAGASSSSSTGLDNRADSGGNGGAVGFAALTGWDPATGLGTPNYQCLVKQIL